MKLELKEYFFIPGKDQTDALKDIDEALELLHTASLEKLDRETEQPEGEQWTEPSRRKIIQDLIGYKLVFSHKIYKKLI